MKSTVYIHPGLPKTGTTAIQYFLLENKELLEEKGLAYPIFNRKFKSVNIGRNGHFLSRTNTDVEFKNACLNEVLELANKFPHIFLTDEELWSSACDQLSFWQELKTLFDQNDIALKMIVYLRRQDNLLASLWAQKIKGAKLRSFSFHTFVTNKLYDVNYYPYLEQVSSVIGKENVIVRPYEFSQFKGNGNTIISDFLLSFGIEFEDSFQTTKDTVNQSIGGNVLEVKRIMNRIPEFQARGWRTIPYYSSVQKKWMKEKKYRDCSTWVNNNRIEFMKQFEEENRRIAEEYLGRENGILFESPVPTNDPPEQKYKKAELRAILRDLQRELSEDSNAPFSPDEFAKICAQTKKLINTNSSYLHRFPRLRHELGKLLKK